MSTDHQNSDPSTQSEADALLEDLTATQFKAWYRERQYTQNIEDGTPYFNKNGYQPAPERHSPSKLLRCHRRQFYQDHNAPEEQPDLEGIFWVGSKFEEGIAFPFLKHSVTDQETYVQNSMWVDYTVDTAAGDLQLKGENDPVIVDSDATPILPTEIKTKRSIDDVSEPNCQPPQWGTPSPHSERAVRCLCSNHQEAL